jgi:hypothetical protein
MLPPPVIPRRESEINGSRANSMARLPGPYVRLAKISLSVAKFESAASVALTISVRHPFSSFALESAEAIMPGMSIAHTFESASVFAVGAVKFFKLVMIVVLGTMLMFFSCVY